MLVVRVTGQLVQHLLHLGGGKAGQQVLNNRKNIWPLKVLDITIYRNFKTTYREKELYVSSIEESKHIEEKYEN